MKEPPRTAFGVVLRILPSTETLVVGRARRRPGPAARNEQVVGLRLTEASITLLFSRYFLSQRLPPPERTISVKSPWLEKSLT